MKTAFIIGHTGQDGQYLTAFLKEKGYSIIPFEYASKKKRACVLDKHFLEMRIKETQPDEIYNLVGSWKDRKSFDNIQSVVDVICQGTINILEAIRNYSPKSRYFHSSSSEMYGQNGIKANETDRFLPKTPYGCSRLFAHNLVGTYRTAYGIHASSGILFNHESPYRDETYVTKKISKQVVEIKLGRRQTLELDNIGVVKDFGYAEDYVEAMWLMLQQNKPEDYVLATGVGITISDFAQFVFDAAGLDMQKYFRYKTNYSVGIIGDPSKAEEKLGWKATLAAKDLAKLMYEHDIEEHYESEIK